MAKPTVGITINSASLAYKHSNSPVFSDLHMHINASQWTCLLGKSGCGKTTLIRYLIGLNQQVVDFCGHVTASDQRPLQGRVAYMAQQDLLFPWLNVLDNVCLYEKFGHYPPANRDQAMHLLEQVGLIDYATHLPEQLSGGMRQRVALVRTLMQDQPLVFMDEPFSALDAITRHQLQGLFAQMLQDKTVLLITHDPQEAARLGHRIYTFTSPNNALASIETCDLFSFKDTLHPRSLDANLLALQQRIMHALKDGQ